MGFLNKLGMAIGSSTGLSGTRPLPYSRDVNTGNGNGGLRATGASRAPELQEATRISNGLKEFLWNLEGLGRGTLLDLGPAWQTTLNFFIERGFRVTSDDILRGWSEFLKEQQEALNNPSLKPEDYLQHTPEARAKKFLKENLQYAEASFDALLLWDVLDYLEPGVAKQTVAHLTEMLRPGAVVFAMFHSKKPEGFQRYRVADTSRLQVLSAKPICTAQKVYQNREIQGLFGNCRTIKTFIGRDQLRETLFLK
jgi:hypothetical protein